MMNKTGTGFKTIKLRSSHSFRPQSAYQEQVVSIIPFEMSEQAYQTSLKMDLLNIEDEIASLQKLGLQQQKLSSAHIQKMKSYVGNTRFHDKCLDPLRVVQICNCTNANEAVVKLYNMIQNFDYYVNKITELQCIHYLQYEQCFDNLQSPYIQKISQQGILPNRFLMSLLNLDIIEHLVQRKEQGDTQLVKRLQLENNFYQQEIQKLKQEVHKPVLLELPQYIKQVDEFKESYQNLLTMLREVFLIIIKENTQLELKLAETQQKLSNTHNELQELNRKLEIMKSTKDDLYKRFAAKYKTISEFEQSYEAALREEYSSMEVSLKQKIQQLQGTIDQLTREHHKKCEQKSIIDSLTDRERLLIKKLSMYQKL